MGSWNPEGKFCKELCVLQLRASCGMSVFRSKRHQRLSGQLSGYWSARLHQERPSFISNSERSLGQRANAMFIGRNPLPFLFSFFASAWPPIYCLVLEMLACSLSWKKYTFGIILDSQQKKTFLHIWNHTKMIKPRHSTFNFNNAMFDNSLEWIMFHFMCNCIWSC